VTPAYCIALILEGASPLPSTENIKLKIIIISFSKPLKNIL
jgi:hypothetical protein